MATPPKPALPPLEDPLHEREIFASEAPHIGMVHGNVSITLANVRYEEPISGQPSKARRIVVGRLILSNVAAGQLLQSLQKLAAQIEAAKHSDAGKNPN